MAYNSTDKALRLIRPNKIIFPILIGLGVTFAMLYNNFNSESFSFFRWTQRAVLWIFIAVLMIGVRDIAFMYRIRLLSDYQLSWKKCFNVIMLWEFSTAISPAIIGGYGPAIFFLYKEGLNIGKSTAIALTSVFLDKAFIIIMAPVLYLIFGYENIFTTAANKINYNLPTYLFTGYIIIFVYTLFLAYALFINPKSVKLVLSWIFLLLILRKWRLRVRKLSNQLITVSNNLKSKSFSYWTKAFVSTIISWTGRYLMINFMFLAFFSEKISFFDHLLIYARQLLMWIILLVSPTPGGSGVAEYIFSDFLGIFIPNSSWSVPLALLWRLISYYPYLFIGIIILPNWIKKIYLKSDIKKNHFYQ